MKKLSIILVIAIVLFGCKKSEVDDVTISYEVTISNVNRPVTIYFNNETGGEDIFELTTTSFSKSYVMKSDKAKSTFKIRASCYTYQTPNTNIYESQTITLKILEDNVVKQTKTVSGSSVINSFDNEIKADLPSVIKYK